MKSYDELEIEVVEVENADVITDSNPPATPEETLDPEEPTKP